MVKYGSLRKWNWGHREKSKERGYFPAPTLLDTLVYYHVHVHGSKKCKLEI